MTDEELEETEIAGFKAEEQTIYSGNVVGKKFLQITSRWTCHEFSLIFLYFFDTVFIFLVR